MKNTTTAARCGRLAGHAWLALPWAHREIDWQEVAAIVWEGLAVFAVLVYLAGRTLGALVHRANDGLARVAVQLLAPTPPSPEPRVAPVAAPAEAPSSEQRVSVQPTPPAAHPLALLASASEAALSRSTVAQLRRQARAWGLPRSLTRTGRRAELIHALAGLEVAAC